jgi:hypothetical protein
MTLQLGHKQLAFRPPFRERVILEVREIKPKELSSRRSIFSRPPFSLMKCQ